MKAVGCPILTGISIRTIRYYLTEGLLPPVIGRGKGARYTPGHRDRLLLIRRLQDAHLPLAAIRAQQSFCPWPLPLL